MLRKLDICFIILFFQIIGTAEQHIQFQDNSKGINSTCKITESGENGICMRIEDCHMKIKDFTNTSAPPETCYFDGATPIVCCPQNTPNPNTPTTQSPYYYYKIIQDRCEEIYDDVIDIYPCIGLGGHPTDDGEYSFMAAIGWTNGKNIKFKCGGFLIEENYVLTSAHCVSTTPDVVRLGGLKLTNHTQTPDDIVVSNVYIHPEYNPSQSYNDIAILKLSSNGSKTNAKPACLWHIEHLDEYDKLLSVGFSISSFDNESTNPIKKVNLTLYENGICQTKYEGDEKLPHGMAESHLCAGNADDDEASCPGDSGGPIGFKRWNACFNAIPVPFVMGMTSFGQGCGSDNPMVYTRMTSYLEWIISIVWPEYL